MRKDAFTNEKSPNLSSAMRFYKEDERGVNIVCSLVQECVNEGIQEGKRKQAIEDAIRMIQKGFNTEDIADITELSEKEIEGLRK